MIEFKLKKKTEVKEEQILESYSIVDIETDKNPLDFYESKAFVDKLNRLTLF